MTDIKTFTNTMFSIKYIMVDDIPGSGGKR